MSCQRDKSKQVVVVLAWILQFSWGGRLCCVVCIVFQSIDPLNENTPPPKIPAIQLPNLPTNTDPSSLYTLRSIKPIPALQRYPGSQIIRNFYKSKAFL